MGGWRCLKVLRPVSRLRLRFMSPLAGWPRVKAAEPFRGRFSLSAPAPATAVISAVAVAVAVALALLALPSVTRCVRALLPRRARRLSTMMPFASELGLEPAPRAPPMVCPERVVVVDVPVPIFDVMACELPDAAWYESRLSEGCRLADALPLAACRLRRAFIEAERLRDGLPVDTAAKKLLVRAVSFGSSAKMMGSVGT